MIRNIFRAPRQRLRVVLDLDDCIVSSEQVSSFFNVNCEPKASVQSYVTEYESQGEKVPIRVNQRPHFTQFLEQYRERFDFDIFTAAMPCYADTVLDNLDPEQKFFSKRYYRDSCPQYMLNNISGEHINNNYAKNLEICLAGSDYYQSMGRIVLVDNSTRSFVQPSNCILVPGWSHDPEDDLFKNTLPDLLEKLDEAGDVRNGVSEWMERHYPNDLENARDQQREMVASCWSTMRSEKEYDMLEEAWDILREYDDRAEASNKLRTEHLEALLCWVQASYMYKTKQEMLESYWEIHDSGMEEEVGEEKGCTPKQFPDAVGRTTNIGARSMNPKDDNPQPFSW